jgi:hypothetical protein
MLTPPYTFWARALTTLTYVRWREEPDTAGASDVKFELCAEAVQPLVEGELSQMHADMGALLAEKRRLAESTALYNAALAALAAFEPPCARRDVKEALMRENLGISCSFRGDVEGMRTLYRAALRLLDRARDGVVDEEREALVAQYMRVTIRLNGRTLSTDDNCMGLDQPRCSDAEALQSLEKSWERHARGGDMQWSTFDAVGLCHFALPKCDTRAQQRCWLERVVALHGAAAVLKAAAVRGCRACGERACSERPLKSCAGCGRVAYCGGACQKADWRRHKRWCAAENAADAALADAMCAVCARPLLDADGADEAEASSAAASASLADAALLEEQRLALPRCRHLAHAACSAACGSCPICGVS